MRISPYLYGILSICLWCWGVSLSRLAATGLGAYFSPLLMFIISGFLGILWYSIIDRRNAIAIGRNETSCSHWIFFKHLQVYTRTSKYWKRCSFFFIIYQCCMFAAIGLAKTAQQVVEIGVINYMWPVLSLVVSVPPRVMFAFVVGRPFNSTRVRSVGSASDMVIPISENPLSIVLNNSAADTQQNSISLSWRVRIRLCIAILNLLVFVVASGFGVVWTVSRGSWTDFAGFVALPIPYILSFVCALSFALYNKWKGEMKVNSSEVSDSEMEQAYRLASSRVIPAYFIISALVLLIPFLVIPNTEAYSFSSFPFVVFLSLGPMLAGYILWDKATFSERSKETKRIVAATNLLPVLSTLVSSLVLSGNNILSLLWLLVPASVLGLSGFMCLISVEFLVMNHDCGYIELGFIKFLSLYFRRSQ